MIKFLRFVPVQLTFFLITGILIGNYFEINTQEIVVLNCAVILLLLFSYFFANKNLKYFNLFFKGFVFLATVLIGVATISFQNNLNNNRHYSNTLQFKTDSLSQTVLKIRKVLKSNVNYAKYEAVVLEINNEKVIGKILLNCKKDSLNNTLKVDDELLVKSEFREIPKLLNPYGFNYKKYLVNQQIHHQIYVSSSSFLKLPTESKTIYGIAATIRNSINASLIKNGFKNNELALINALLLGQRQTVSDDLLDDYKDAGAVHILAVSGLHIGVILLLLLFLFKSLHQFKNGKLIATSLIVSLLWFYAVIAGLSPSVVRAVAMFTALSVGLHLNKPSNIYNNLVISMFFLLLFHPFYLFEIGFQLSYLAVFSIVWIQPKLENLLISEIWFFKKAWQLFTVSIAAQLGILPLSLFYFHQFPGLFFVANMLIIPFLGFILISGIVIIILSLFKILPQFLADFYTIILKGMNGIITWVSTMDYFIIRNITLSFMMMISIYLCLLFVLKWLEKRYYYRLVLTFIAVIFLQFTLILEKYHRQKSNEFIVFNNYKESIIGLRKGDSIVFNSLKLNSATKSYLVGTGVNKNDSLELNHFLISFKNLNILVVDSLGLYNFKSIKPNIVVLQQSPKINLERLINKVKPEIIIADATNYKSYINKWETTCIKNKTPFYNTMQKGAYILKE
ncbi:ComEC/Rec2 family competence protein [Lutibacter sp.]|uniref:ComEC/Rec2 family competence protein n=1 Tax=Lutibacter sp. TaxID=1925666 RepID=UPI00356AA6F8